MLRDAAAGVTRCRSHVRSGPLWCRGAMRLSGGHVSHCGETMPQIAGGIAMNDAKIVISVRGSGKWHTPMVYSGPLRKCFGIRPFWGDPL